MASGITVAKLAQARKFAAAPVGGSPGAGGAQRAGKRTSFSSRAASRPVSSSLRLISEP